MFATEQAYDPPYWLQAAIWLPTTALLSLALLRPVKGATLGLMLKLGMTKPATSDSRQHHHRPCDPGRQRIERVMLDGEALTRLSPVQEADRQQATADLALESRFALPGHTGPYLLHLSVQEGRLVFDIRDLADAPLKAVVLALGPFRGLIKDYQMLVDSH